MIGFAAFLVGCWLAIKLERRPIAVLRWGAARPLDVEIDTFYIADGAR